MVSVHGLSSFPHILGGGDDKASHSLTGSVFSNDKVSKFCSRVCVGLHQIDVGFVVREFRVYCPTATLVSDLRLRGGFLPTFCSALATHSSTAPRLKRVIMQGYITQIQLRSRQPIKFVSVVSACGYAG